MGMDKLRASTTSGQSPASPAGPPGFRLQSSTVYVPIYTV